MNPLRKQDKTAALVMAGLGVVGALVAVTFEWWFALAMSTFWFGYWFGAWRIWRMVLNGDCVPERAR